MIPGGIAEYLTIPSDFDIRHRFIGTFVWQLPCNPGDVFAGPSILAGGEEADAVYYR
jgi:hypothetical protein